MIRNCTILILLLVAGTSVADTREAVVTKYVAAFGDYKFEEAGRLIRGSDLAHYKSNFSILFRAEAQTGKTDFLRAAFGDKATLDDALNASPEAVFAATMKVVMSAATRLDTKPEFLPPKILGEVSETPELVHVLVRSFVKLGDTTTSKVEVISMAPEGKTWKIILPEQLKAMGQIMLKQTQRRQQQ
jgi:hypothetical protein